MSNIGQIMAECGCQHSPCETLGYCMAARIIELEAGMTDMHEGLTTVYWSGYEDGKKAMEAKLAKAVEALGFYATLIGEKHECPWHMLSDDFGEKARAALAELGDRDMCKNFTELREGEG